MTSLIRPDATRLEDWAAMVDEYEDDQPNGSGLWEVPAGPAAERFTEHLARSAQRADLARPMPDGKVHADQYWIADGEHLVGFIQLRHRLTEQLLEEGGHIGYSVRPSARRHGHAGRALGLALGRARELGLERVLITCDDDNVASARTIESHRGELEDVRKGKRRYWIRL